MRYTSEYNVVVSKARDEDIGIDLPTPRRVLIDPGATITVDTGLAFELPLFGRLRRFLCKMLLGVEVAGVAGLIWPRSSHDILIKAGVVDAGYRGTIKVKVYNPDSAPVWFAPGDFIAQFVPVLSISMVLCEAENINTDTKRKETGGIKR